ncbi:MAG: DUF47 family protein [Candidatus Azobacteroides sp.]|jgi:predicted phosphate transport protein (TIGR00153 family)|nr:DUF47 family protein [Candidatus Azobacteroides sp.]
MKLNTLLSIFTPKDVKFFPLLRETASILVQSSDLLYELFSCTDVSRRDELCKLIKAEELKGDKVTGYILKAMNETFVTPFDREDINALADEMDDVIDGINRAAQKVLLYSPENMPECTLHLSEIIRKGASEIQSAVIELPNIKKNDKHFRQHYREIKHLEEEADVLYEVGIMNLFKEEKNTIELIKLKEIIQELEKAANKINNTGKVFKTIFVKYA